MEAAIITLLLIGGFILKLILDVQKSKKKGTYLVEDVIAEPEENLN